MKLKAKKDKNRLVNLTIKEEKSLKAQYEVQIDDEKKIRKEVVSDMREYLSKATALRGRVSTIQSELESREEEVKEMKEQFEEWQDYISSFDVQLNTKDS